MSLIELEYQHTTSNIAGYIIRTINKYKIENFIFSITFDNASANNSAIEILKMQLEPMFSGNFFHVRCVCHILNLCVKDGLKIIDPYFCRVIDDILYAKFLPVKGMNLKDIVSKWEKKYKKFISDLLIDGIQLMQCWNVPMIIKMFLQCIAMSTI